MEFLWGNLGSAYIHVIIALEGCGDASRALQFDVYIHVHIYECVYVEREREREREREGRGREEIKKLIHMYIYSDLYLSLQVATSQKIFLCYSSPLSHSPCWGCDSAPPTGPGLHSGWLSGNSLFTVPSCSHKEHRCDYWEI